MKWKIGMGLFITILFFITSCTAQKPVADKKLQEIISEKQVLKIESELASDEMQGRKIFTPGIEKAAAFIASQFKDAGLTPLGNDKDFLQDFSIIKAKQQSASVTINGKTIDQKEFLIITSQTELNINQQSGYEKIKIGKSDNLQTEARKLSRSNKNVLVLVDKSLANNFGNLSRLKSNMYRSEYSVVFVLTDEDPGSYEIKALHEINEQKLSNVVGIIPGKSKKNEYVIFSGHYDHLGVGKPVNGDSIYNGANDDAAGVTAVIMLANYFKAIKNNERTIVFAAFTAEESGGFGAQYFSRQFDPASVVAMFNIEMIGTESKWGKNSAYITGYEKTDMGEILKKNLQGTGFEFYPDPYPTMQLFYRSDNATLARLGVPAHTISTSKMDVEPHYHKPSDEVKTLDIANMTEIIKSIAISAKTIIAGKDTPSRVKIEELR
jgi:hypothetical protein